MQISVSGSMSGYMQTTVNGVALRVGIGVPRTYTVSGSTSTAKNFIGACGTALSYLATQDSTSANRILAIDVAQLAGLAGSDL